MTRFRAMIDVVVALRLGCFRDAWIERGVISTFLVSSGYLLPISSSSSSSEGVLLPLSATCAHVSAFTHFHGINHHQVFSSSLSAIEEAVTALDLVRLTRPTHPLFHSPTHQNSQHLIVGLFFNWTVVKPNFYRYFFVFASEPPSIPYLVAESREMDFQTENRALFKWP